MRRNAYTATLCFLLVGFLAALCVAASPIVADRRPGGMGAGTVGTREAHAPRIPLHRAPTGTSTFVPGRLLVKFRSDVLDAQRKVHLAAEGLTIAEHLALLDVELVSVPVGQELDMAKELGHHPAILYAEPDYIVHALAQPNDPYYAFYQWNMPHIGLEGAWDTTTGDEGIVIAVIDSGVDLAHPDLAGKLVAGYDYVNDDSDPSDDNGHGTHVAGIAAAATNNTIGVAGVSWGSKVMPVKVLASDGWGSSSDIAQGIQWAADHGADILNLSLGGDVYSTTEANAVNHAYGLGCLVVAAAGNDFEDGNDTMYPAAFNHVLGVGAVGDLNEHADYSNTGYYLDVVAPGGNPSGPFDPNPNHWIRSTYWQGSGNSYASLFGTSMACPHVAGLAALLWSVNSALTNDEVSDVMTNTATDLGVPGRDDVYGWGVLEANAAVAAASAGVDTPTPTCSPTITRTPTTTRTPTITPTPMPAVWHRVVLSGRRVRDIISQPGSADVLMACTEGSDLGVWVTTNAGGIWTQVSHGLVDRNIYKLAQEPGQPWTVYAESIDRLWKTTNGGQSWNYVSVREPPVSRLSGLATDPLYAGRLYLTAWEPCSTMFVSEDGGSSWDEHPGPDFCSYLPLDNSIAVSSITSGTLYLARAHDSPTIYSSEDAGEQWELLTAIAGGELTNDLALDPTDDEHLYAATFGAGVYVTDDGGTTWQAASYGLPGAGHGADVTALWVNPNDPAMVYAAVQGEGVYISRDGGGWWKAHGGGFSAGATVYALYASPQRSGRLWAATDDGVWMIETYNCQLPLILKDAVGPATATPTVTATVTVTDTPTPTHTPTMNPCPDRIEDGSFEWVDDVHWLRPFTLARAVYTTDESHWGFQSMRMGIEPGEPVAYTWSATYQYISIPSDATSAMLRFWWQRHTEESPLSAIPLKPGLEGEMLPLSSLNYTEDLHLVVLYDPSMTHLVEELERGRANDSGWVEAVHDLTPYRGDTLVLYFNAYNHDYSGRTWMYVDDVELEICLPGSP